MSEVPNAKRTKKVCVAAVDNDPIAFQNAGKGNLKIGIFKRNQEKGMMRNSTIFDAMIIKLDQVMLRNRIFRKGTQYLTKIKIQMSCITNQIMYNEIYESISIVC